MTPHNSDNSRFSIGFSLPVNREGDAQKQIYDLFKEFEGAAFVNAGSLDNPFRSIRIRAKSAPEILQRLREDIGVTDLHGLDRELGRQKLANFLKSRGVQEPAMV